MASNQMKKKLQVEIGKKISQSKLTKSLRINNPTHRTQVILASRTLRGIRK